jgi:chromosome segregation ATPase
MRRLLADVEGRAESKVRDFKERLEAAIEERDRAEDETSTIGRRRAREVEDLKVKAREAERALRRAEEDRDELERAQKDWKRRREEMEAEAQRSGQEVSDVRQAMSQLRDALDESEKQLRNLEKEKSELRRAVEETNQRLEKLRKSNKTLSDDIKAFQSPKRRDLDSGSRSERSSLDSGAHRRIASPVPKARNASLTGAGTGAIDYVYLKNVLLQFLEQKDKNNQKQLIPVLGMLLQFDQYVSFIYSVPRPETLKLIYLYPGRTSNVGSRQYRPSDAARSTVTIMIVFLVMECRVLLVVERQTKPFGQGFCIESDRFG